jgi:acyl carrier protein
LVVAARLEPLKIAWQRPQIAARKRRSVAETNRMSESDVYSFLSQVFADVFGRSDISLHPGLTAQDVVGWDSFKQVEITLALEDKYGIRIRTRELNDVANLGDLVTLVVKKAGALG